jgi:hypothetical protein
VSREIPVTRAAVVALATEGIIAITFRSGVLTRRASAHEGQVYRAPENFTNSPRRAATICHRDYAAFPDEGLSRGVRRVTFTVQR